MKELINFIKANNLFDTIIASDSNTKFIDWIIKKHDFIPNNICTNKAAFDE